MRHSYFTKLFIVMASVFIFGASSTQAQISPLNAPLGIYGSVRAEDRSNVRYVRVEHWPVWDGGPVYYYPTNGLSNFNIYYLPDGNGFLAAGVYQLTYMDSTKTIAYGLPDVMNYPANSGYSNNVQVRSFNIPPPPAPQPILPLGINGTVRGYRQVGSGTIPIFNATIKARPSSGPPNYQTQARTNGDGFFSVYYDDGEYGPFLPPFPHWSIEIHGYADGCTYFRLLPAQDVIWTPTISNPNDPSYYVTGAEWNLGVIYINPTGCVGGI